MKSYLKWVMPGIQAVVTAVLLYLLVSSRLLPGKYMAIVAAAALVPLVITSLMALSKKSVLNSAGTILAIFMSGVLLFGVVYVRHILKTLDQIAGADTQIETIAVAVQDSNAAQSVEETGGYRFGAYEGANKEYLETVIGEVQEANGDAELNLQYYETPLVMAQDLLDGNVDAVICNKAYIDLLDDAIGEFSQNSRVILEREFETRIEEAAEAGEGSGSGEGSAAGTADVRPGTRQRGESVTAHPFNILISGIDVSGPISTTSRSDVNIIMTVNPQDHRILLTTTPRDYYVYISKTCMTSGSPTISESISTR